MLCRAHTAAGFCGVFEVVAKACPEPRLLLFVSNEPSESRLVAGLASRSGWRTIGVPDAKAALRATIGTDAARISIIVIDNGAVGEAACDLICELKSRHPDKPIVLLTTSSSAALAIEAMRAGASDYLIKPFPLHRLMQALRLATGAEKAPTELQPLSEKLDMPLDFETMIGAEPVFRTALAQAARSARGNGNVLVQGESGTGKDMLLRAMHAASRRASMPLQWINVRQVTSSALDRFCLATNGGRSQARLSDKLALCRIAMAAYSCSMRSIGCRLTSKRGSRKP